MTVSDESFNVLGKIIPFVSSTNEKIHAAFCAVLTRNVILSKNPVFFFSRGFLIFYSGHLP